MIAFRSSYIRLHICPPVGFPECINPRHDLPYSSLPCNLLHMGWDLTHSLNEITIEVFTLAKVNVAL